MSAYRTESVKCRAKRPQRYIKGKPKAKNQDDRGSFDTLAVRESEEGFIAQTASDRKPCFDAAQNDRSAVGELGCRGNPAQNE